MMQIDPYQLRNWLNPVTLKMALIVFICACGRFSIHAFAPPSLSRLTSLESSNDENSERSSENLTNSIEQAINEERKIRAAYFLQSSGFTPTKSTIPLHLDGTDDKSSDSLAKQSMASLEQAQRQSLLSRISNQDPLYKEYVQNLSNEWNEEWEFRLSASEKARFKARVKLQQRLEAFLALIRQREEGVDGTIPHVSLNTRDDRPRFGMPYGKVKTKQKELVGKEKKSKPVQSEAVADRSIDETPILGKIMKEMEEKRNLQDVATDASSENTVLLESIDEGEAVNVTSLNSDDTIAQEVIVPEESKVSDEGTTVTSTAEEENNNGTNTDECHDKPTDNLRLVQSSPDTNENDEETVETGDSEAAAKQRAAAARAAQEKADRRVQERLDAVTKEREEAKAQVEAILNHSEEEERLHMEEQRKKADAKLAAENEAALLKAKEVEEEQRWQAEVEELARLQMEEEKAAMLKAQEEEKAAMLKAQEEEQARLQAEEEEEQARLQAESIQQKIDHVESKMKSLTDKATGVTFEPKLDDGLYLVGVGVRKKAIINIYSVAMYASPAVLEAVSVFVKGNQKKEAITTLRDAARTFDESSPKTSFVLEMVFKADAKTIAGAIADSVRPRYDGPDANVKQVETLIFEGVSFKGGQATKGTVFRFDCSGRGVSVSVDGEEQGEVMCDTLGSAFVDVFMDEKSVSPKLVDSCIETWCESGL